MAQMCSKECVYFTSILQADLCKLLFLSNSPLCAVLVVVLLLLRSCSAGRHRPPSVSHQSTARAHTTPSPFHPTQPPNPSTKISPDKTKIYLHIFTPKFLNEAQKLTPDSKDFDFNSNHQICEFIICVVNLSGPVEILLRVDPLQVSHFITSHKHLINIFYK